MNVERRIKVALSKGEEGEPELRSLAVELGASLFGTGTSQGRHLEHEVVARIREAARSIRDGKLWWIALISAIASVISAFAAWIAIIFAVSDSSK